MKILLKIALVICGGIAFAQRDTSTHEIPWKPIQDSDILWKKRVWREISVYEKQNAPLRGNPISPQENIFANVLLNGINAGLYKAYAADTNSDQLKFRLYFKHPLTKEDVKSIIACDSTQLSIHSRMYINYCAAHKNDTSAFVTEEYLPKKRKKRKKSEKTIEERTLPLYDTTLVTSCNYPQQVDHYGIIEDWIFDKAEGIMVVHIDAIAPMVNGKPLFWLSYPDIRRWIAQYEVYSFNNEARLTWDEYFESRQFSSKITKAAESPSSVFSDH